MAFGKLQVSDLIKHGTSRVNQFLQRIQNREPFTINDTGEEVFIDPDGQESKETISQLESFRDTNGKSTIDSRLKINVIYSDTEKKGTIAIGKLRKDAGFGGGGGIAGGSYQTKYVESGQCLVNALFQDIQGFSEEGLSVFNTPWNTSWNNLKCSFNRKLNPKKIWDKIVLLDSEWKTTLLKIASHLVSVSGGGYWHWQDAFVKSIEDLYNSYEDRLPGKVDRWNPADIWFTRDPLNNISEVLNQKPENCKEFTSLMNDLYKAGKVVGISLKKLESDDVSSESRSPRKITISNVSLKELGEDTKSFKIFFTEGGVDWTLQIRAGNGWNLRVSVGKSKNSTHFDGGCSQTTLENVIQHTLGVKDLSPFQPISFKNIEYPVELISEGKLDPRGLACRYAIENLYNLLKNAKEQDREHFVRSLVEFCWSIRPQSALHYKVW